jgi:hypothetical protein
MTNTLPRTGHAPGHARDTFAAVLAWDSWDGELPEPVVPFEVHYEPHLIPISRACALVWNCTDALPGDEYGYLRDVGLPMRQSTYAAAARALLADIKRLHREQDVLPSWKGGRS